MDDNVESRIRLLISVRRKLQAQLIFSKLSGTDTAIKYSLVTETYVARIRCLLEGIDGLLLLVTEEERLILQLHLVEGLKWETVMEAYGKVWTSEMSRVERTYKYRQQGAIKKMCMHVEQFSDVLDFSWLEDPMIDELALHNQ